MGNFEARFTQDEAKQQELAMRMSDVIKGIAYNEEVLNALPSEYITEVLRIQIAVNDNLIADEKLSVKCLEESLNDVEQKLYKSK